jgi:threonine/homoserine/homoserine lactone efflux protein
MPIDILTLLTFCMTCLLIELTPGPNMAYLAIISSRSGKSAGYFATAGIALGLLIIGVAASMGLASLIHESSLIYQVLRWCGILFLLWLAWDAWRDADISNQEEPFEAKAKKYFLRGLMTNLLNPKAGLFYIAVLPRFTSDDTDITRQLIFLSLIYVAIASLIHLTIVSLTSQTNRLLHSQQARQNFSRILAVLLAIVAIWFAWITQPA